MKKSKVSVKIPNSTAQTQPSKFHSANTVIEYQPKVNDLNRIASIYIKANQ